MKSLYFIVLICAAALDNNYKLYKTDQTLRKVKLYLQIINFLELSSLGREEKIIFFLIISF